MINLNTHGGVARAPPKAVTCFVCGRAYGTASIGIHLKQCKARFLEEEAQKPPRERRPLPPEPSSVDYTDASTFTADALEAANDAAFKSYNSAALNPCAHCGRTFLPSALVIHNRSCTADKPHKRPVAAASSADEAGEDAPRRPSSAAAGRSASAARLQRSGSAPRGSRGAGGGGGGGVEVSVPQRSVRVSASARTGGVLVAEGKAASDDDVDGEEVGGAVVASGGLVSTSRFPLSPSASSSITRGVGFSPLAVPPPRRQATVDVDRSGGGGGSSSSSAVAAQLLALSERLAHLQEFVVSEVGEIARDIAALSATLEE